MKKKIGFIVNPVAGMGGKVGLKGTDGEEILAEALKRGATPESPIRASQTLAVLAPQKETLHILTYPGDMGQNEIEPHGFETTVLGNITAGQTTAADTEHAAQDLRNAGVDLLLFVGGDGTARNIHHAVGDTVPVLGIPAGVKMHSAVFATNPRNAGQLTLMYLNGKADRTREAAVMDINEEDFRDGRVSARLYGYLRIPYSRNLVQSQKAGGSSDEEAQVVGIASQIVKEMQDNRLYIVGPGTTMRAVMRALDLSGTLLGVDVVRNKEIVAKDVNEHQLLEIIEGQEATIIVTIIGGQGYLFGRGNQQLSSRVIRQVGKENIIVAATLNKIVALEGAPFLVDTGDDELNQTLSGYIRVTTGLKASIVYRVEG